MNNNVHVIRLFRTIMALCFAGLFSASVAQATIVIDPFTADQSLEVFGDPPAPQAPGIFSIPPACSVGSGISSWNGPQPILAVFLPM